MKSQLKSLCFYLGAGMMLLSGHAYGQRTDIKGFVNAGAYLQDDKGSFAFGEQDLFITSVLTDRISFLGETVFRIDSQEHSDFTVSIERIVLKYNINGNHNILLGKHHTPLNYWNDTYHHGRLFFPTIDRPLMFRSEIIPLHTTGISLQGHDLGKLKWGYDLMFGNGLGSSDVEDNDKHKSISAAMHIKPVDRLRIGASYYNDVISEGAEIHERVIDSKVNQQLYSGSVAYFGKKFELLAEATAGINHTDSTGQKNTQALYLYGGYKISEKLIPYVRYDYLNFEEGELYYTNNDVSAFLVGVRYQFNFLTVIKLEYQVQDYEATESVNRLEVQVAIGF